MLRFLLHYNLKEVVLGESKGSNNALINEIQIFVRILVQLQVGSNHHGHVVVVVEDDLLHSQFILILQLHEGILGEGCQFVTQEPAYVF